MYAQYTRVKTPKGKSYHHVKYYDSYSPEHGLNGLLGSNFSRSLSKCLRRDMTIGQRETVKAMAMRKVSGILDNSGCQVG